MKGTERIQNVDNYVYIVLLRAKLKKKQKILGRLYLTQYQWYRLG